jgi:hypothetical protein
MKLLEWLIGPEGIVVLGGAVGGIVGAITHDGKPGAALRIFLVGALSSYFLAPLAIPFLRWGLSFVEVPSTKSDGLAGFIVGVFGIVFLEIIRVALNKRRDRFMEDKDQ